MTSVSSPQGQRHLLPSEVSRRLLAVDYAQDKEDRGEDLQPSGASFWERTTLGLFLPPGNVGHGQFMPHI